MKNLLFIIFLSFINLGANQENEIQKNQSNFESMGYSVYIIRPEEKEPISKEEWLNYAKNDPEIKIVNGDIEVTNPQTGKKFTYKADNLTYYLYQSEEVTFSYGNGDITVSDPNDEIIFKMLSIAKELDAIVMGDGGVIFNDSYFEKKSKAEKHNENSDKESSKKKNSKWKFWN
ncbi:hypothetical protein [uncultured Aquimarina sp.]|uniref:hypothetical protein n=1 Tax=uncultured Aquimarina sp. TaxID=575652 RepID=UPI0026221A07|nr:hypothetical protein [uncultured Aquimarina sp.]